MPSSSPSVSVGIVAEGTKETAVARRKAGNAGERFVEIGRDLASDTADRTTARAAAERAVASAGDDDASLLAAEETSEAEAENVGGEIDGPAAKVQRLTDEIGANETRVAGKAAPCLVEREMGFGDVENQNPVNKNAVDGEASCTIGSKEPTAS